MTLFPERLIQDLQRLPGGRHSFLTQVCAPEGKKYRAALERLVEQAGEPMCSRGREMLTSLDNRKFFQGYAEVVTAALAARGSYEVKEFAAPGPAVYQSRAAADGDPRSA